jgi:hypothetical protein
MQLHTRLIPIFVAALVGSACSAALADTSTTAQIYLQRGADGRVVLTDRPSPTAVTERTWQMDREDPVAARQRAAEVRREADAVSERIQRSIEAQERRASEADLLRLRLAWLEQRNDVSSADDGGDAVAVVPVAFVHRRPTAFDNRRPQRRPDHTQMRPATIRGSTWLESR